MLISYESYAIVNYEYDNRNRLITEIDRGKYGTDKPIYTQYEYDNVGNVTRVVTGHTQKMAKGAAVPSGAVEYKYEYDRFGNVTKFTDGLGNVVTSEYNLMGLPTKVTDRNGVVTKTTYNGYGSPLVISTGSENEKKYTYNVNNLLTKTEFGSEVTNYTYDDFGNVASEVTGDLKKKYSYDTNGNLTGTDIYRGGVREMHEVRKFDNLDRLTLVNNMDAITASYTYTANGNVSKETKANLTTTYVYTYSGCLKRKVTNSTSDGKIQWDDYKYDMRGNVIEKSDRVKAVKTNYTYDGHNRLVSEKKGDEVTNYTYDGRGNRIKMTTSDTVVDYVYDNNNRLISEEIEVDGDSYSYAKYTYTYDDNGNRLSIKTNSKIVEANAYNEFNQLTTHISSGKINDYTYDISGLRNSKTANGVTTKQIWSMGELAMEINGADSTVKAKYYHGLTPIGMRGSDEQLYYTTSYNGTVDKVTNLSGKVVADYTYDAFGNQQTTSGNLYNPIRYCGEYYDSESGLIYLRNRYYDSGVGAFINEDPIRDGLNWYVYCEGNPVNRIDPSGKSWDEFDYFLPVNAQNSISVYTENYNKSSINATVIDENGYEVNARNYWHSKAFNLRLNYLNDKYLNYAQKDFQVFGITEYNFKVEFGLSEDTNYTYDQLLYSYAMELQNNPTTEQIKRTNDGSLPQGTVDALNALAKVSKLSGKQKANDVPSWAKGQKPNPGESGKNFAERLCDEKYGKGNYDRGPSSEYNKIRKWGDRGFN